jgi:hypothetical protein
MMRLEKSNTAFLDGDPDSAGVVQATAQIALVAQTHAQNSQTRGDSQLPDDARFPCSRERVSHTDAAIG